MGAIAEAARNSENQRIADEYRAKQAQAQTVDTTKKAYGQGSNDAVAAVQQLIRAQQAAASGAQPGLARSLHDRMLSPEDRAKLGLFTKFGGHTPSETWADGTYRNPMPDVNMWLKEEGL